VSTYSGTVRWTSSLLALSATLLLAPIAHAQAPPLAAGEIARVAGAPVLKTDYDHWVPIAQASAGDTVDPAMDGDVRTQVVHLLISFKWIEGEAARHDITVKPGAVYTRYQREKRRSFPREADFQRFLQTSHQTVADLKARVRVDLLAERIQAKAVARAETRRGRERLLARFVKRFSRRWRAQTVCGEGFVSENDCGTVVPLST
jgi:hypothetical protein